MFGIDKWFGIRSLSGCQQYNLVKGMQGFYYEALVKKFCKITFFKCDNYIKSVYGENLLLMIHNHTDLFCIALAENRQYALTLITCSKIIFAGYAGDNLWKTTCSVVCCFQLPTWKKDRAQLYNVTVALQERCLDSMLT
ncbi:hypothetical protein HELRODRAFT_165942 [Helobdella robusta]|uniref:Uncharacterized protein n=1 Tax=Helobdella robusta TaxID=6412 RepID=T1EXH7_HELRO|nr:hypothetical protein HELRODRAFT_165942 [Helobdella robusta]ESN90295.1 hypothetical protein HELRODRAFT_165942 [Helobdella robusta]